MHKNTEFVDVAGRRIKKLVGGKHFVFKMIDGKRVKVQGNKAAKRADGRNIADLMTVPAAIRPKKM
jgi:hypothetical protein